MEPKKHLWGAARGLLHSQDHPSSIVSLKEQCLSGILGEGGLPYVHREGVEWGGFSSHPAMTFG